MRAVWSILLLFPTWLQAQSGVIRGTIYNALNNEPLPYANVIVINSEVAVTSDIDGNYEIDDLEPGLYSLRVSYVGFQEKTVYEIKVTNSKPAVVDISLEENANSLEEVVVQADPFKKSEESLVSVQSLGVAEIERNPGANRDISKVIQSLPGVSSTVAFRNDVIVRGGGPNENVFYLDGIEIPNINHFATQGSSGGPIGILNVDMLEEATLYTGGFPANRGNTLSSVLSLSQRDGREDRFGGKATVGASDLGLLMEGPIGKNATYLASVRRSYLQFLFDVLGLPFLPNYTDAQFRIRYTPSPKHEFILLGLGAYDQFELNLDANEDEFQKYLLDNLPISPQWNYTNGLVYKYYRDNGYTTFVISRSMLNNRSYKYEDNDESDPDNLLFDYRSTEAENKIRVENTSRFDGFKLNVGLNAEYIRYTNSTFQQVAFQGGVTTVDFSSLLNLYTYGGFAQLSRSFFKERLAVSLGVRMDANDYSNAMDNPLDQLSPRLSLSYRATDQLSFNGSAGIYYQLPSFTLLGYRNGDGELVNQQNGVTYIRAMHGVLGAAYTLPSNTRISIEGFYKKYDDYPFLLRDSVSLANLGGDFGVVGNEPATSTSEGRAYGMELFIQQKLFKGFYGLLAYTFVRSEFKDKDGAYRPSAWDDVHLINFTAGKKFKNGWEAGLRFRFGGGRPYTPVDESFSSLRSVWDVRGVGVPDWDRLNGERLEPFHNLDLRVDKKYYFKKWSLNLYFDLQNVYNFAPDEAPILVVERDSNGEPLVDPNDSSRYQTKFLDGSSGTVLPTLGVIIEY